ncbi:hypothetical protein RSA11_06165 [Exiguobacterium indicum]|uniref:Uncharacterized protein n=1 Tax=Exiguobacterium indicum TaxID=296995 RepID=A0AAW3ME36_9BACL|nr:hypothetical protein [Exiguobacterium indicum]KTR27392.1 hypothetical protein RSA11_06165 [Exiguobacterium indicum]
MVAFLQFYAFIFACCFAWQVGRPSPWSQKIVRAFLTSVNGLFVFARASISIFLLVGPLLLVTYLVFPRLIAFENGLAMVISVLVIGLVDRLVSLVVLPLIRSFFLKRQRVMPQSVEMVLYTMAMAVLLFIQLHAVPGVQIHVALTIFLGFTIYFAHYLFALYRIRLMKKKLTTVAQDQDEERKAS